MSKSRILYGDAHHEIEAAILQTLNAQPEFLSARTAVSPRAVGDAVQGILSEEFQAILGLHCAHYSAKFARRAMADLAFTDVDGLYYVVDVKTHRLGTSFSMPNLTSVERIARFYEDDQNYFVLLIVKYDVTETSLKAAEAHFVPIEFLSWECLTIGALGWGQVQIANANTITINEGYSRRRWMLELCDAMLDFYPKEIAKIDKRIERFRGIRQFWEAKVEE